MASAARFPPTTNRGDASSSPTTTSPRFVWAAPERTDDLAQLKSLAHKARTSADVGAVINRSLELLGRRSPSPNSQDRLQILFALKKVAANAALETSSAPSVLAALRDILAEDEDDFIPIMLQFGVAADAFVSLSGNAAVCAREFKCMLDFFEGLLADRRIWINAYLFRHFTTALRRIAARIPCHPSDLPFFERAVVLCERLQEEAPELDDDVGLYHALSLVVRCDEIGEDILRRVVRLLRVMALGNQRLAPPEEATSLLALVAQHPKASTAVFGDILGVMSGARAFKGAATLRGILWHLLHADDARHAGHMQAAVVARSFVFARQLDRDDSVYAAMAGLEPLPAGEVPEVDDNIGCPAVLGFLADTPVPMELVGRRLRHMPAAVLGDIGDFVGEPDEEVRAAYLGAVAACVDDALEGNVAAARALWLATCIPVPAAAFAGVAGFVRAAAATPTPAIAEVIQTSDLLRVAGCLGARAFPDDGEADREVELASSVLAGAALLDRAWSSAMREEAAPGILAICDAALQMLQRLRDDPDADLASLQENLAPVCDVSA